MEQKKTIDEVIEYIKVGYGLNISATGYGNTFYGTLILVNDKSLVVPTVLDIKEIALNNLMKYFPNITEHIGQNQYLKISYDEERKEVFTSIMTQAFFGPYDSRNTYIVVKDLEVKTPDILTGLLELDSKIALTKESEKEVQKKKEI